MRSGLLTLEQLEAVPLFDRHRREALAEFPALAGRRLLYEAIRRMLSVQVYDVIAATRAAIEAAGVASSDEVRAAPVLVRFSPEMHKQSAELKRFLMRHLYRHPQVLETTGHARQVVTDLYAAYCLAPAEMPDSAIRAGVGLRRRAADYIAGMTDRFAIREHQRLTGLRLFS